MDFCWEDSETGCICGHGCEPPEWMFNEQPKTRPVLPHTFGREDPATLTREQRRTQAKSLKRRGRPYKVQAK
ncbi:hypothetical protein SEA_TATTMODD_59 [Arthrobacter phage TattModd]|uniref:Uncharacterized protein n=8 Tax=Korravirus TaxID=1982076 RepID=A0A3S9UMQ1_9CAUD|nr:hypothetical protein KDJ08_gp60 [Arthrobacter phage Wawa]ALY09270.1 hypothetical protein IMMACULATA_60 [Arthrobacter phage Immaculata]AOT24150.1 hypothetical protein SEA_VALLEJO_60 [Arthrobacter phage Vallejo]ASR83505.1 hypothetical protein SEA_DINO_60 [Arthrobacter phage Dino]AZS10599.1 hypothetical protein SEA_TATTMODD_59 [Arthrobacter phage TattModd]AZS11508.1 hypothetical protein SEA_ZORRO_60 [Arthrobacter phage Zorro]AZS11883.1 hypothetical protein SEA_POTATOES_60 [Arthrobacter phage 